MFSLRSATLIFASRAVAVTARIGNDEQSERALNDGFDWLDDNAEVGLLLFDQHMNDMSTLEIEEISDSDYQELIELTKKNFASEWVDEEGEERDLQVVRGSWCAMIVGGFGEDGTAVGVSNDDIVRPFRLNRATRPSMKWYFVTVSGSSYGVIYNGFKVNGAWRCLDYNFSGNYVYAHACHSGNNQRWKPYSQGELQTLYGEGRCLDYDFKKGRMYMHTCHTGWNQNFVWTTPPVAYALT